MRTIWRMFFFGSWVLGAEIFSCNFPRKSVVCFVLESMTCPWFSIIVVPNFPRKSFFRKIPQLLFRHCRLYRWLWSNLEIWVTHAFNSSISAFFFAESKYPVLVLTCSFLVICPASRTARSSLFDSSIWKQLHYSNCQNMVYSTVPYMCVVCVLIWTDLGWCSVVSIG